jgi:hypothetical protein
MQTTAGTGVVPCERLQVRVHKTTPEESPNAVRARIPANSARSASRDASSIKVCRLLTVWMPKCPRNRQRPSSLQRLGCPDPSSSKAYINWPVPPSLSPSHRENIIYGGRLTVDPPVDQTGELTSSRLLNSPLSPPQQLHLANLLSSSVFSVASHHSAAPHPRSRPWWANAKVRCGSETTSPTASSSSTNVHALPRKRLTDAV